MKKMIKDVSTTFLIILFLGINWIYAQKQNFTSGIIHFKDGTSKEGFIEKNTFAKLGQQVLFQESSNTKVETFLPTQISGFTFKETDTKYSSVSFKYYNFIKDANTYEKTNESIRFAKILLTGEVDLLKVPITQFEYNKEVLGSKSYLYLIKKGDEFIQIDLLKTKLSGNARVVSKNYKGLLTYALIECDKISKIAEKTEFTDKSIINIISDYHDCIGYSDRLRIEKEDQPKIISHYVKSGYIWVKDDFIDTHGGFNIGYQVASQIPAASRNLGFALGLDYIFHKYNWDFFSFAGDYKESNIRLNLALDIYMIQREQYKIKLSPSFGYYFLLSLSPSITPEGVGNYQLFELELFAQIKKIGIFYRIGSQPDNIARPNGIRNIGLSYQFN